MVIHVQFNYCLSRTVTICGQYTAKYPTYNHEYQAGSLYQTPRGLGRILLFLVFRCTLLLNVTAWKSSVLLNYLRDEFMLSMF